MDQCYKFVTFEKIGVNKKFLEKFLQYTCNLEFKKKKRPDILSAKRKNVDVRGLSNARTFLLLCHDA